MHDTAMQIGKKFFEIYRRPEWKVAVDCGAMNINGSLRKVCPDDIFFLGVDIEFGKSVDVKVALGEPLPFSANFADCVLSSSQLEHDDFFWQTFLEYCRIVKPGGCIYVNTPSNGYYHRYPNDNWRFYPDCGHVLVRWAKKNNFDIELAESFIGDRDKDVWNDYAAVFVKGIPAQSRYIADEIPSRNVWKFGRSEAEKNATNSEDMDLLRAAHLEIEELRKALRLAEEKIQSFSSAFAPVEVARDKHSGSTT